MHSRCLNEGSTSPHRNKNGVRDDQLSYYEGELRLAIEYACAFFRVYLATVNPFPSSRDLLELPDRFFNMACERVTKRNTAESISRYLPPASSY